MDQDHQAIDILVHDAVTSPPAMRRERWGRVVEAMSTDEIVLEDAEQRAPTLQRRFAKTKSAWQGLRELASRAARGEADPDETVLEMVRRYQVDVSRVLAMSWYVDLGGEG